MMCVNQFEVFRCTNRSIMAASEVKHLGGNSEQTVKHPKEVFSRKHRAHRLNAVPGYWCKIAEHCKQILLL